MTKKDWPKTILEIVYIVLSIYLSQFLASRVAKYLPTPVNISEILYYLLYILLIFLLIYYLPCKINIFGTPLLLVKPQSLPTFTDLGLAPIAFVFVYVLTNITTRLLSSFEFFDPAEAQDIGVSTLSSSGEKLVFYIILCIIIPIIEELIFRRCIYDKLKSLSSRKFWTFCSIFIVSVIFACMHGQWNVGIMAFWLSFLSCLLREITGTCYSGIILHIMKNTIAFLLLYVVYI